MCDIKKFICFLIDVSLVLLQLIAPLSVMAADESKTLNQEMTFILNDDELIIYYSDTYKEVYSNKIAYIDGKILSTDNINIKQLTKDDLEKISKWELENQIEEIIFSDNVVEIYTQYISTFFKNVSKIVFGNKTEVIGGSFFSSKALEIIFPDSLKEIKSNAFESCCNIKCIIIPHNTVSISHGAFLNCNSLKEVTILSKTVQLDKYCLGFSSKLQPYNDFIIKGYTNSTAETYANENGFTFIALDEDVQTTTTVESTTTSSVTTKSSTIAETTTTSTDNIVATTELATASSTTKVSTTEETIKQTTTKAATTTAASPTPVETTTVALGDVNEDGAVDASDASRVLAEYANLSTGGTGTLTGDLKTAADVNGDDVIDASDASLILAFYAYVSTGGDIADMAEWLVMQK